MQTDEEFQLDIVQRLTRLETKIDYANGNLGKACADIIALQRRADIGDAQWSTIKKILTFMVSGLGVIATLVGILAYVMR